MKWTTRIVQGLLVLAFIMFGFMKLTGNAQQVELFTEDFGYSKGFMYLVGACEVLGAIGLAVGFRKPKITLLASFGFVLLMAGAVFSHLHAGQGMSEATPAIILFLLSLFVLIRSRSTIKSV
ncbi:DoxX family protein [Paenibacillus sp. R14(2021)]|uniref:DoxX family protein n=1 Tax=Paenibacillus sp. R14(2021) TaxID=2859228 RepID=UPI001C614A41|nr:DoxX family protein [Paenibacillus sp. R14(2021)]